MKKYLFVLILLIVMLGSVPVVMVVTSNNGVIDTQNSTQTTTKTNTEIKSQNKPTTAQQFNKNITENVKNQHFKLLNKDNGKSIEYNDFDFTIYALAYNMPISYEKEALKAEAIAIYTYYSFKRETQKRTPNANLMGCDFSYSAKNNNIFYDKDTLKDRWGKKFADNYALLETIVSQVLPTVITYKGELIESVTCDFTVGLTENGDYIKIKNAPYLQRVASPFDQYNSKYTTIVKFEDDKMRKILENKYKDIKLTDNFQEWFSNIKYNASGNVTTISVGDKKLTGKDVKKLFSLPSSAFDILFSFEEFIFNVKGSGDFVGMSLYGANEMAKQGSTYKEILLHYYSNVDLTTI